MKDIEIKATEKEIECIKDALSINEICEIAGIDLRIGNIRRKIIYSEKCNEMNKEERLDFIRKLTNNEIFVELIKTVEESVKYNNTPGDASKLASYNAEWLMNKSISDIGMEEIEKGKGVYITDDCRVYIEDGIPYAIFRRGDGKYRLQELVDSRKISGGGVS